MTHQFQIILRIKKNSKLRGYTDVKEEEKVLIIEQNHKTAIKIIFKQRQAFKNESCSQEN
jgi:hypothetical protein